MFKTLEIIPDRTVENKKGHEFTRALHDLFIPWHKRLHIKERKMDPRERFWYLVRLTHTRITFHIATSSETFMKQRLGRYWPRAAIQETSVPPFPSQGSVAAEMRYRRHNIFSLSADWREETVPIAGILNVLRDMREGDEARLLICAEPYSRTAWADWSDKAHDEFKKGKTPRRIGSRINLRETGELIDNFMQGTTEVLNGVFDSGPKKRQDLEKREIMLDGRLERTTMQKRNEPVFRTRIFILSHSPDADRRSITLRSLANAFSELAGDNELKRVDYGRSAPIVQKLNDWVLPFDLDTNLMSATEVGKMIQVPTAQLQDEYKDYLKVIEHRETAIPVLLTREGIKIGTVDFKRTETGVFIPVSDWDELCLPRIVIGGMGQGKTKGFGGNFGAWALQNGFSVFSIDVAKDELNDEIAAGARKLGVPDSKIIRLKFGKKAYRLDWSEAGSGDMAANRLAGEALNFFNLHGHEAGVETSRYIRMAAKTIGETKGTLADMMNLFLDRRFRKDTVAKLKNQRLKAEWAAYEALSEGMKGKVTDPVLNRMDMLTGDEYLLRCMESGESLDFTKWMTGGYHVAIHIPQKDLGREVVDILVDFLMAKIELAMFARPEEQQIPAFVVCDEPHQFISCAERWERMVVETRKWRLGMVWMFHEWNQIPDKLIKKIKSALPHYHIYPSSPETFQSLALQIKPFKIDEALQLKRFHAINVIRAGGEVVEPFIARMDPPPSAWAKKNSGLD